MVDLDTKMSHDGYFDEKGTMCYKKEGTPISDEFYNKMVSSSMSETAIKHKNEIISSSHWVTAPRWARFSTFLKQTCIEFNIQCSIDSEDRGLISITTYYTLTGRRIDVVNMDSIIDQSLQDYINR